MLALVVGVSVGVFAYGSFKIIKSALRKHKNKKEKEV